MNKNSKNFKKEIEFNWTKTSMKFDISIKVNRQ